MTWAILILQIVILLALLPFFIATALGLWTGWVADKHTREDN